jgi:hypothetical protein
MDNKFYIHTPYFSAWQKYGWQPGDYGIGLEKNRIDKLSIKKKTVEVNIRKEGDFTINSQLVKDFPVEKIKNHEKWVYIVRRSALNKKKTLKDPEEFSKLVL